jgi:hypothetical protein
MERPTLLILTGKATKLFFLKNVTGKEGCDIIKITL